MREIKEFIEMIESNLNVYEKGLRLLHKGDGVNDWRISRLSETPEYQALKDKLAEMEESQKRMANFEIGRSADLPDKKATDTQDNDGWILNLSHDMPIAPESIIDVATFSEDTGVCQEFAIRADKYDWRMPCDTNLAMDFYIIAYRIIEEPKEENAECDVCDDAYIFGMKEDIRATCQWCEKEIKEQEPKKQTLLEYTLERYGSPNGNVTNMNADCVIKIISEYLEKNK